LSRVRSGLRQQQGRGGRGPPNSAAPRSKMQTADQKAGIVNQALWTAVDDYFAGMLVPPEPALGMAVEAGRRTGLPMHHAVSPSQGRFLQLLVNIKGAKNVLEIGTLFGYSTIWLARGLPSAGRILSLELHKERAEVARSVFADTGLDDIIEVRAGPAADTLRGLVKRQERRFDFIFIDADKPNNPAYFRWALELAEPGAVIIFDNQVRQGAILDPDNDEPSVRCVRELVRVLHNEPRVRASGIQTVGSKGHDGFVLAQVKSVGRRT
jgi:predicted O-methyltransferase YrrM